MEVLNDILGYKNRKIYQDDECFSFSLDSVLLSNFVQLRLKDNKILDMCSGNGVIPLLLSMKTDYPIEAVEIQKKLFSLFSKSIRYNSLENKIFPYLADVKDFAKDHLEEYDVITCNPPYFKVNFNNNYFKLKEEQRIARHEIKLTLDDFLSSASYMLKNHGNLFFVHRPDRLEEIFFSLRKYNLFPKTIQFVYHNLDGDCLMILVRAQKCGKMGLKILKPFYLYECDGTYSKLYKNIVDGVVE